MTPTAVGREEIMERKGFSGEWINHKVLASTRAPGALILYPRGPYSRGCPTNLR
jgi:hypothetical protein